MNQVTQMSQPLCGTTTANINQINDVFPNGVAVSSLNTDPVTNRITQAAVASHVTQLQGTGIIPPTPVPGANVDITDQIRKDQLFYGKMLSEYCFYEARYKTSLTKFITDVSDTNAGANAGADSLQTTINLNKKLNSILEIMNYIGTQRASTVNTRNQTINSQNTDINNKLAQLQQQQNFLQSSDVRLQTQSEMMRYSKEKNSAMNIQIMFFIALNVVALGTMLTVYKNLKPM